MYSLLVKCVILASLIEVLVCDCELKSGERVPENSYVCDHIDPKESNETFGSRFSLCLNAEFQTFQCDEGMTFDVITEDCRDGPPRCSKDEAQLGTDKATDEPDTRETTEAPPETLPQNESVSTPANSDDQNKVCSEKNCKLPSCFCLGSKPKIEVTQTPMMVMLGFDDAVTKAFMTDFYQDLLIDNKFSITNPNNCSVKATFFLSAANTDYAMVKTLVNAGNEFASHTVNHILVDGGTKEEYKKEIVGIRDLLVQNASANGTKVDGFRAPFLKLQGEKMFEVLQEEGFKYDSSISNVERKKGNSHLWPFTLDYPIPDSMCPNGPCSKKKFPGLWEFPMNVYITQDGNYCAMIDACIVANTTDDQETVRHKYFDYFMQNFYEDFYPEKVPMHVFTHSAVFLRNPGSFQALVDFLREIIKHNDVWIVTVSQALDWMKNPATNMEVGKGAIVSWNCHTKKH